MRARTALAWLVAAGSFTAYVLALAVSPGSAGTAAPWCAAAFFAAWLWLAYKHDQKGRRR